MRISPIDPFWLEELEVASVVVGERSRVHCVGRTKASWFASGTAGRELGSLGRHLSSE